MVINRGVSKVIVNRIDGIYKMPLASGGTVDVFKQNHYNINLLQK